LRLSGALLKPKAVIRIVRRLRGLVVSGFIGFEIRRGLSMVNPTNLLEPGFPA